MDKSSGRGKMWIISVAIKSLRPSVCSDDKFDLKCSILFNLMF